MKVAGGVLHSHKMGVGDRRRAWGMVRAVSLG